MPRKKLWYALFLLPALFLTAFSHWIVALDQSQEISLKQEEPICYINTDKSYYTSIEKALEVANQKAASGTAQTVYVVPKVMPEGTENPEQWWKENQIVIDNPCTIGANVTLTFAVEGEQYQFANLKASTTSGFSDGDYTLMRNTILVETCRDNRGQIVPTLTIESGGTLNIGGQVGGASPQSATCGMYVELNLSNESVIANSGTINCIGFIQSESDSEAYIDILAGGVVKQPLAIYDYSSAATAAMVYFKDVFPFNRFDLPNISTKMLFHYQSEMYGLAHIYGDSVGHKPAENEFTEGKIISWNTNNSFIVIDTEDSVIEWRQSYSTPTLTKDFYKHSVDANLKGNFSFGYVSVNISIDVTSEELFFPIPGTYHISIGSGTYFINYQVKFLPGASLHVEQDATLNINANTSFYPSNKNTAGTAMRSYTITTPATLTNDGIININSGFSGKITAGQGNNVNSKININILQKSPSKEHTGGSSFSPTITDFTFPAVADIALTSDAQNFTPDSALEQENYSYATDGTNFYWTLEGYLLNFSNSYSTDNSYYTPSYQVDVRRKDGTQETFVNPELIRVYEGEAFIIRAIENVSEIQVDGKPYSENEIYPVNGASHEIEIVPTQRIVQPISSVLIQNSNDGESWGDGQTLTITNDGGKRYFRANTTIVNDGFLSPNTQFSWACTKSGTSDTLAVTPQNEIGDIVSVTVPANEEENDISYILSVVVTDGYDGRVISNVPTITINVESGCFVEGTRILMADGIEKTVEDIRPGDQIMAFDHKLGRYVSRPIALLVNHGKDCYEVIKLRFDNGESLEIISEHALFDLNRERYETINKNNVSSYIEHDFVVYDLNDVEKTAKLVDYTIQTRVLHSYGIFSSVDLNAVANGFLTMTPYIQGMFNVFEIDEKLRYDPVQMEADIKKYGLFTYKEWSPYISRRIFDSFNVKDLKVAIGKGMVSFDKLLGYVDYLNHLVESGQVEILA